MLTVVMQGQVTKWTAEFANRYAQFPFVKEVIVSTWDDEVVSEPLDKKVYVVFSAKPDSPGPDNRNLQLVSSRRGCWFSSSAWTMKIRSDMFIADLPFVFEFAKEEMNKNPSAKIITLSMYEKYPFHPRDHMFLGHTHQVCRFLENIPLSTDDPTVKNYNEIIRSETHLGIHGYMLLPEIKEQLQLFWEYPKKYLTDNSQFKSQALELSNKLIKERRYFVPLPQVAVEFPKHFPHGYPFELLKKIHGEVYS